MNILSQTDCVPNKDIFTHSLWGFHHLLSPQTLILATSLNCEEKGAVWFHTPLTQPHFSLFLKNETFKYLSKLNLTMTTKTKLIKLSEAFKKELDKMRIGEGETYESIIKRGMNYKEKEVNQNG